MKVAILLVGISLVAANPAKAQDWFAPAAAPFAMPLVPMPPACIPYVISQLDQLRYSALAVNNGYGYQPYDFQGFEPALPTEWINPYLNTFNKAGNGKSIIKHVPSK
jgi:hypothetical protein